MISMTEISRTAVRALRRNKTRSMLTALGIIIGVAAVIAAFAVGQGANKSIDEQIASFGSNFIMIFPDRSASSASGTVKYLTYDDALAIERE
ncbi:MAG: ABC transporter permease, partial [Synergistaceae bacterium]|nr:ABC transporter permease [Synergistaceae bacterium]